MKKAIFIGCGAVASEIISYMEDIEKLCIDVKFEICGFIDDSYENFQKNSIKYGFDQPYLGTIIEHSFSSECDYYFGLASPKVKELVISRLKNFNILSFPNIVHPSVIVAKTAKLGMGNVIYPNTVLGPNCRFGNFNLITSYSFISHDCQLGDYNFLSTAGLAGDVKVGNKNFFGIRSTVIPSITIGDNNTIQAGMVLDKSVSNNETVFYRFKEKVTVIKG